MVSLQTFSVQGIVAAADPAAAGVSVEVVQETGSTNTDLLARVATLKNPHLLIAERQSAGRGRAGRSWHTEAGASLAMSLAWPLNLPRRQWTGLPLAVAVTLSEACDAWGLETHIKWPNDLLMKTGAKLAGILIEAAPANNGDIKDEGGWVVVGIGFNLAASDTLREQVGREVGAAPAMAADPDRAVGSLLASLAAALNCFDAEGLAPFTARWNARHAHAGQEVAVVDRGEVLHRGVARGIDEFGRLLLDTAAGRVVVASGDVSLRLDIPVDSAAPLSSTFTAQRS
jgi:BirA family biotin operon repressor/biotin-[acetyl-CoA-carboxylase] ligase